MSQKSLYTHEQKSRVKILQSVVKCIIYSLLMNTKSKNTKLPLNKFMEHFF